MIELVDSTYSYFREVKMLHIDGHLSRIPLSRIHLAPLEKAKTHALKTKDPFLCFIIARNFMKTRWEESEKIILTSDYYTYMYATHLSKFMNELPEKIRLKINQNEHYKTLFSVIHLT